MKRNSTLLFILLAAFAILAGCQTEDAVSPLSASLSELSGFVQMKQEGQGAFEQASANSVLNVNGQVQTGDDGRVRLDLSSGTIIRISPSSVFTLTSNDEAEDGLLTKIKLEVGKIFIILNGGQADVETPSGVASVRGSYMKVEVDPETNTIYITCLEGNCSASNPAGTVNFTNGQRVILFAQDENGNWQAPNVEPMTPEEFREWLDNNPEAKELFDQAITTLTAMAQSTETPTEESTSEPTEEPTEVPPTEVDSVGEEGDASNACSQLQEPMDGSALGNIGQVLFAWSEQPNAQYYELTFINADSSTARIQTQTTNAQFYIEVLPKGGSYQWFVTAYGSDGTALCSSNSATFSKPQADPTEKPKPTDDPNDVPANPPSQQGESTCPCDPYDYLNYSDCIGTYYDVCSEYPND